MKKMIKYALAGMLFGFILTKGEAVSWFRMQEMFRFQGFHMYGLFMTAIPTGAVSVWLLKRYRYAHRPDSFPLLKKQFHKGMVLGGFIFGLGWGVTGACPGPIYAQIGSGAGLAWVVLFSALAGTWTYAWAKDRLPH